VTETAPDLAAILNLRDFEDHARRGLERAAFDYIAGGGGDERTLAENERAFARYQLRPRVLVDVSAVEPACEFLGRPLSMPVGTAPMAFQHFAHPDAELATARAAARAGALFCLSTMSSRSMEDVARAADDAGGGPRWFQLYVHRDRALSAELVQRADAAGFSAIVVTVDLPVASVRERDVRNRLGYPQVFGNFGPRDGQAAGEKPLAAVIGGFNDASFSWGDLGWLRGLTRLPLVIKGILTGEDAVLAVEHGVAGVIVSNHGGRQLDRSPPAIDVLAEVVEAVAGRAEVFLDSGVKRGVDVLTALALGARGVFIGRPLGYALAVGGEAGVLRALEILAAELRIDMALLGVTSPGELGRAHVRFAGPAGQ
jgi:4-hydroxymandelate oxidase